MESILMRPNDWAKKRFAQESRPSASTVRRWIDSGSIPGKKIGGAYFVEVDAEKRQTGNALADRILAQ